MNRALSSLALFAAAAAAAAAAMATATACASRPGVEASPCLAAARSGPPQAALACPADSQSVSRHERRGAVSIPTPRGNSEPLSRVAKTVWCADRAGTANGAYVGLDLRGRVVRSGRYERGEARGVWIDWDASGRPIAIVKLNGEARHSEVRCR